VNLGKTTNFGFLFHATATIRSRSKESFDLTTSSISRVARISVETKAFSLAIARLRTYTSPLRE
jgi:hypothetical protein